MSVIRTIMPVTGDQYLSDSALNEIFRLMDSEQTQKIVSVYRETMAGLSTDLLKVAGETYEQVAGPLVIEHIYALEELDAMKQSKLGAVTELNCQAK